MLLANTHADNKNIILHKVYTHSNVEQGIYVKMADGTVSIRNVRSFSNNLNGIYIGVGSRRVIFDNSAYIGNL